MIMGDLCARTSQLTEELQENVVLETEMKEGRDQSSLQHQGILQKNGRMVQRTIRTNHRQEISRLVRRTALRINTERLLQINWVFQIKLPKRFEILGEDDTITIEERTRRLCHRPGLRRGSQRNRGQQKLRPDTKDMLKSQREMNISTMQEHQKGNDKRSESNKDKRSEGCTGNWQRTKEMYSIKRTQSIDSNAEGEGWLGDCRSVENSDSVLSSTRQYTKIKHRTSRLALAEQGTSILKSKIKEAVEDMTNVKSPGGDQAVIEKIKVGGDIISKKKNTLKEPFHKVIEEENVPQRV